MMAETTEQLIRRIAAEYGVDGDLAVAMARQESSLNPRAVGDQGHSVGLFQLNDQGMGYGMGDARYDPETNARTALRSLAQTIGKNPGVTDPGRLAAMSQRPFDPTGYARSINAMLGGGAGRAHTGSAFDPNAGLTMAPMQQQQQQGTPPVSGDNPNIVEARRQRDELQQQLDELKAILPKVTRAELLVSDYRKSPEKDAVWLPAHGVTKAEMDELERVYDAGYPSSVELAKRQTELEDALRKSSTSLADAQTKALVPKTPTPKNLVQNFGTPSRPDYWLFDPDTGEWGPWTNGPKGDSAAAEAETEQRKLQAETARFNFERAKVEWQQAQEQGPFEKQRAEVQLEQARVQLAQAQAAEKRASLPVPVEASPTLPSLVYRNPETGVLTTQANPNYRPPLPQDPIAAYTQEATRYQGLARAERDRLLQQQQDGTLTADQAQRQFQDWFDREVSAPLSGLRAMAEQARRQQEDQQAAQQRQEDQRVEALNRQRQQTAYTAGEQARSQAMDLAPQLRSPEYQRQFGSIVSAMSQRAATPLAQTGSLQAPSFTAAAFDPAGYQAVMPNFDAVAQAATNRALANISPAVAAQIGRPIPQLPQGIDLQALLGGMAYVPGAR